MRERYVPYKNPNPPDLSRVVINDPTIPAISDSEVFVSPITVHTVLRTKNVTTRSSKLLWNSLLRTRGVDYVDGSYHRSARRMAGGLTSVRFIVAPPDTYRLHEERWVSVDGLIDGLGNGDLAGSVYERPNVFFRQENVLSRDFGPVKLAQVALLGLEFTPDRETEIRTAMDQLQVRIHE